MEFTKQNARIAGLFYLILIVSGIFSLLYLPSELIVWDNSIETEKNITSSLFLFKLGLLSDIIMYLAFALLSLSLYKLLKNVNQNIAITMVVLVLISVSISFANLFPKLDAISLIEGKSTIDSIDSSQQLISLLRSHNDGILMIQLFWGAWLLPFGYLVWKSGFLPRFFGILLMIGCFGYLSDFLGYFLFPDSYGNTIIPSIATIPHALGEIGICFWFLIVGVKRSRS